MNNVPNNYVIYLIISFAALLFIFLIHILHAVKENSRVKRYYKSLLNSVKEKKQGSNKIKEEKSNKAREQASNKIEEQTVSEMMETRSKC
jgi:hypothetical protein